MNYNLYLDVIDKFAFSMGYKYYEVVEDNYEGEDKILLIIYSDQSHENEINHYVLDENDCKDIMKGIR